MLYSQAIAQSKESTHWIYNTELNTLSPHTALCCLILVSQELQGYETLLKCNYVTHLLSLWNIILTRLSTAFASGAYHKSGTAGVRGPELQPQLLDKSYLQLQKPEQSAGPWGTPLLTQPEPAVRDGAVLMQRKITSAGRLCGRLPQERGFSAE